MRQSFIFPAFVGLVSILASSPSQAESLQEAVRSALTNHPSVEAALAQKDAAVESEKEEHSGHFPEINTSASGGRMFGNNSSSRGLSINRGEAYSWLWEGSASITQPIFNGMETFNRVDAARARSTSSGYNVLDIRENLALRAVQSYINVLRAMEVKAKVQSYQNTIGDYLDRVELMVDEGVADETEAAQARNISILLENTRVEFEGQLKAAYAEYNEVVGNIPDGNMQKPTAKENLLPDDVDTAVEQAKANHPLIMAAFSKLEAAGYDVDAEKGTLYPDLNGEVSYLKRDQVEELGGEAIDARALLRMNWKFAVGGGDFARIRKTKANYSEVLAESRDTIGQVERDIRIAYSELDTSAKQLELIRTREEVTQDLYEAYKTQFEGSRVRLLQLMQAENQLFNTQMEAINSDYRHLLAQFGTLASVGRLQQSLELQEVSYEGQEQDSYANIPVKAAETPVDIPVIPADNFPVKRAVAEAEDKEYSPVQDAIYTPVGNKALVTPANVSEGYAKSSERVYPDLTE